MEEVQVRQDQRETAEREHDEATCLKMLADADEQVPSLTGVARRDRAVARELEMEADYLRTKTETETETKRL
jgi:hypothetical protein